jgi:hypothetical protein
MSKAKMTFPSVPGDTPQQRFVNLVHHVFANPKAKTLDQQRASPKRAKQDERRDNSRMADTLQENIMTTILTRVREIAEKEGFDIVVTRGGKRIDSTENGVMGKYDFDKKLKGSKTVSEWIKERFERTFPGLSCEVLNADGTVAIGQTKLETVRSTYEE